MNTILGAGGAIGIELAKALKSYTNDIRLVARNPKKVNDTDTLFPADLTVREQVFEAIKGSEIVYLVVGFQYKISVWREQWPKLITNVMDACMENNSKLVFFDNVYMIGGDNVKHITEESPISPVSKKGEVRAKLDKMILDKVKEGKLTAIIARSADFYGPDGIDNSVLMGPVYNNLAKGKKAQWLFNAKVKHSFTYTPDAGKALAILGNTPAAYNQVWNMPTDPNSLTGEEWIKLFADEMKKENKYTLIPAWLVMLLQFIPLFRELYEMRYQYDRDYFFDSSKFDNYFKFKPTPYVQGVRETLKMLENKS